MKNKTVVVGLSGGVDSSVTAYLLKKQGYNVIGVTMQVWQKDIPESGETGIAEVEDARKVAAYLGIPHYVLNFNEEFHKNVIEYFVKTYNDGKTPNPCVVCNRYVKWQALREKAGNLGADYIATGHYAKIEKLENGRYAIKNSKTAKKDQTYALHLLTQEQLEHTIMPLGSYEKDEVRKIAERVGIPVAHKKDSQDMCFIPDGKYANFIYKETGKRATKPLVVKEVKVVKPVAEKQMEDNYHIIVAGGITLKDAEIMAEQLKAKGFHRAKVLNSDGKVRVSIMSYATREEAMKQLLKIRENEAYKTAWMLAK